MNNGKATSLVLVAVCTLSACTPDLSDHVAAFNQATSEASDWWEADAVASMTAARASENKLAIKKNARATLSDGCLDLELAIHDANASRTSASALCAVTLAVPQSASASGENLEYIRQITRSLREYVGALNGIMEANSETDLSSEFMAATDETAELANKVADLLNADPPNTGPIQRLSDAFAGPFAESLAYQKHKALDMAVRQANVAVQTATLEIDKAIRAEMTGRFDRATKAANTAADTWNAIRFSSNEKAKAEALVNLQSKAETVNVAAKAAMRPSVFAGVGTAHQALFEALDGQTTTQKLDELTTKIGVLKQSIEILKNNTATQEKQ